MSPTFVIVDMTSIFALFCGGNDKNTIGVPVAFRTALFLESDMKFLYLLSTSEVCLSPGLWIRINFFLDPDPDPEFDVGDQYGSGSNTDPVPLTSACSTCQREKV